VIGTLSYLPPEQARRENDRVGPASDVFGLGGILCEILTGSPPFRGKAMIDLLKQSTAGDLSDAFARLDGCGADAELVQLAKSCLAADPADRPADGGVAATRMGAYLEGVQQRLRAAGLERAAAQARAEEAAKKAAQERRARRVQLGLSAAVLLVLLAGIAGTTVGLLNARRAWGSEAQQRQFAQEKQHEAELSAEQAAAEQGKAEKAEKETLEDYRASTDDAIEQLIGSKPVLGAQEKAYLEKTLKRWQAFAARTGNDERSRMIRAEGLHRVAYLRARLGQTDEAIAGYRASLAIRQKLADDYPTVPAYRQELARSHNNLGVLLKDQNRAEEPAEHCRKALAIRQKLADDFPSDPDCRYELAGTYFNLGKLLRIQSQGVQAAEQLRKTLDIQQKLAGELPALAAYRQELARTHDNLALLLASQNEGQKAVEQYLVALDIRQKLTRDFPDEPVYRQELAWTHNDLGVVLKDHNQPGKAAEQYRKALDIQQKLASGFPALPAYRQELARTHNNLGLLLAGQNQLEKSAQHYHQALELKTKLADDFPDVPAYRRDLASTHHNLGLLLAGQNQPEKAAQQYRKALDIRQKLAGEFPHMPEYRYELATTYLNLGELLRAGGKPADSLPWYDRAIRALTSVHRQDPRMVAPRLALGNSHAARAMAHDQLEKHAEALKDWTRAIDLSPPQQQRLFRSQRASTRVRAGQPAEAVAEVAELTRTGQWPAEQWYDFACIYALASGKVADKKQEYADQAMRMLRQAVQAGFKDAEQMAKDKDLDVLRSRDDFKKLMQSLAKPKEKR
jgi:tetratricopeptide (TPR) repeat protein